MTTDLDHANLCARIYAVDAATDPFWAHYWNQDDIVCGHVVIDTVDYIVFRGSVTPEDWMRDLDAIPVWHPKLGFVHAGFVTGLDALYSVIEHVVGTKIVITGHSLGAARACLTAGLFACDASQSASDCPVTCLCTFGQPKPAWVNLSRIVEKSGMRHVSYKNRNDPVTEVPFFPYVNTETPIALNAEPSPTDLEPLRDHHISLYQAGVAAYLSSTSPA